MSFNYENFISEISTLIDQAKNFSPSDRSYDSDAFRKWRHRTQDSIYRIEKLKYNINYNLTTRQFHIFGYGSYSKPQQDNVFNRDLGDTINELELIVEQYKNYGTPNESKRATSKIDQLDKEVNMPDKITLKWLIEHMPLSGWLTFLSLLGGAFSAGYGLHSAIYSASEIKPISQSTTSTNNQNTPIKPLEVKTPSK